MGRAGRAEAGLFGDQGKDAVAGNDNIRPQFVASGEHADDLLIFLNHFIDPHLGQQHCAFCFGLLREPAVEFCAQNAVTLVRFRPQFIARITNADGVISGHQDGAFANDKPLQGGFIPQILKKISDRVHVEAAARDILGAGVIAPFQDQDFQTVSGQRISGSQPGQTGAGDDHIKFFHLWMVPSDETQKPGQPYPFPAASATQNSGPHRLNETP